MKIAFFKKFYATFERKDKNDFYFLLLLIIITMFLEIFGIGLVIPVIMAIFNKNFFENFSFFDSVVPLTSGISQINLIILTSAALVFFYFLKSLYLIFFLKKEGEYIASVKKKINSKLYKIYISYEHYGVFKSNTSQLMSNVTTDSGIFTHAIQRTLSLLADTLVAAGILALLFVLQPQMLLFNLALLLAGLFFFNFFTKKKNKEIGIKRKLLFDSYFLKLKSSFDSVKEINIYGKNNYFAKLFDTNIDEIFKIEKKFHILTGLPKIFYEFIAILLLITVIIYFSYTLEDTEEMLTFLAVAGASAFRLIPSANRIVNSLQYLEFADKAVEILSSEISNYKRVNTKKHSSDLSEIKNFYPIEISNVSFKYENNENYILKNINLKINQGDKILISGRTGSGKSTFIELILGLLKPTTGSIEADNKCVNKNFKNWAKKIGYVPQKIAIIDDTILANIAFGIDKQNVDMNLLNKSIDLSELRLFIEKLPEGINTPVGEMGSKLSGGQSQRLGIARAIYKNPEILILDESTNAVDDQTQTKIVQNLLNEFKNKILLFISHDDSLSTFINQKFKVEDSRIIRV